MAEKDKLLQSENMRIRSDSTIPNVYNTVNNATGSERMEIKMPDICDSDIPAEGSDRCGRKTPPVDNNLSEDQFTRKSDISANISSPEHSDSFVVLQVDTTLFEGQLVTTGQSGFSNNNSPPIHSTEFTYNVLSEDQLFVTGNSSDLPENGTQVDLTEHNCGIQKDFFTENHETLIPQVNQSVESLSVGTAAGDKPFGSNICGTRISRSAFLMAHKRPHSGEKPFVCDTCGRQFSLLGNLRRHKRSHTGEKPFKCNLCEKRFAQGNGLSRHKRSHGGEKPFSCDICDKRFTRLRSLNMHTRLHTGEKPFVCEICDRRFSYACSLVSHRRTHTGEKPYVCDVCDKSFSNSSNLIQHKRAHHGATLNIRGDNLSSCDDEKGPE